MNNTSNAKRFILELVIFSIPASLYGLMSLLLLVSTGEVISLQTAAHIQIDNPAALFGRAYRDDFRAFKYEATRIHDADVLALGSSRVMQFRSPMFPGVDFYNAGGAAANVYELRSFLEQLPADVRPATVIVGLDQDWFHPIHAQRARETDVTIRTMDLINFEGYINLARVAVADFLAGNTILTEVLDGKDPYYENAGIGLQALRHMSGFRSDGSHQYGTTIIDAYELSERREGVLARLYRRGSRFEFGSEVDHGAIAEVELTLTRMYVPKGVRVFG